MEFVKWVKDYEGIIAVFIAVLGWLITYRLNVKAQRKAFLNQIQNSARLDITKALRDYQGWLTEMIGKSNNLYDVLYTVHLNDAFVAQQLSETRKSFNDALCAPTSTGWVIILEEYETLFPETRKARVQLLEKHREIKDELVNYSRDNKKKIDINLMLDQVALIEDLRIYIQNNTLGEITGNTIPEREPKDPRLPKLVYYKGQLEIIEEHKN
ncbi:MAG: hypothetical protein K6T66_06610 [Peptococcaceae bacterium]|nr:hypothetical protein [Peptococcaceae bacterium]